MSVSPTRRHWSGKWTTPVRLILAGALLAAGTLIATVATVLNTSPANAVTTYAETTGGPSNTWTNYTERGRIRRTEHRIKPDRADHLCPDRVPGC